MKEGSKKAGGISFEILTDILYIVIKFQFFYCALLYIYFKEYQNGRANFQPLLYMGLLLLMILVYGISVHSNHMVAAIGISAVVGFFLAYLIPIEGNRFWFLLAAVIAVGSSFIKMHPDGNPAHREYGIRFRKLQRLGFWGAGIILVQILHTITSNEITETYRIQPIICQYYMIGAFIIYVTAAVLMRYTFRFMDYYRQCGMIDAKSKQQVRHSGIMAGTIILFSIFLFILLSIRPLTALLNFLVPKVLYAVGFCVLFLSGKLKELNKLNFDRFTETTQTVVPKIPEITSSKGEGIPGAPVILVMIILVGSGWMIWKLYKNILANYELGNDKAEFIPVHEKNGIELSEARKPFYKAVWGNTNNEKIRKYYAKVIKKRMEKVKSHRLASRTPIELTAALGKGEADRENIKKLTQYYEKARYGDEECSTEEVSESKKIIDSIEN